MNLPGFIDSGVLDEHGEDGKAVHMAGDGLGIVHLISYPSSALDFLGNVN